MCKCCQSCLETLYWHLIEKNFCYDETIALYDEQPQQREEKNNNMFDNLAFYDSVAKIAGRAIVTIDPLPSKIIVAQPTWRFETPVISKHNETTPAVEKVVPKPSEPPLVVKTVVSLNDSDLLTPEPVKIRKKSLRERRMSKCLSLNLSEHRLELPVIRQSSVPKFYVDTPSDYHAVDHCVVRTPSVALGSPVAPNCSTKFNFDLRSVVQMEKERFHRVPVPVHRQNSRLANIRERLKPLKIKRHASTNNLPHTTNYI